MPFITKKAKAKSALPLKIVKTNYISLPVEIPDSFLSTAAANTGQVTYTKIDFSQTPLPEYQGLYAVILDNVLSPSECTTLIRMAQRSSSAVATDSEGNPESGGDGDADGWQPAMVNAGPGAEFLATDYRNSDRIIWDERTVVQRLLERCFLAEQARADLEVLDGRHEHILGQWPVKLGHRWRATRLNERMRFLRYGPGHFFKEHCDGTYSTPDGRERTFYTLHLYLNDSSSATATTTAPCPQPATTTNIPAIPKPKQFPELLIRGGATTFHSRDLKRRLDVNPKAGRVLIFQHRGLLHSGDEVLEGVKYTMRTDLLFELDEAGSGVELGSKKV